MPLVPLNRGRDALKMVEYVNENGEETGEDEEDATKKVKSQLLLKLILGG